MLKNFVTDIDLEIFAPNIKEQMPSQYENYKIPIARSFQRLCDDLYMREVDPLKCMKPVDLFRPPLFTPQLPGTPLQIVTHTVAGIGNTQYHYNRRRLVVEVANATGDWLIRVQGSNRIEIIPDQTDMITWVNDPQGFIKVPDGSVNIVASVPFTTMYKWIRFSDTPTGGSPSITYSAYLVETSFDELVVWGALDIIYDGCINAPDDIWQMRRDEARRQYDHLIDAVKFTYDKNDDDVIIPPEENRRANSIRVMR